MEEGRKEGSRRKKERKWNNGRKEIEGREEKKEGREEKKEGRKGKEGRK